MLNAINAELMKVRKNKIWFIGVLFVILVPIFFTLQDLVFAPETANEMPPSIWLSFGILFCGAMVLPIMSGFVIAFSIQQEYQNQTVVNVLTAPVSRTNFIMAKVVAWFLWYVVASIITISLYILGYFLIYTEAFNLGDIGTFILNFTRTATLSFIAHLPLLWVAVKQRKTFYPALLVTLVITSIQVSMMLFSEETLLLASLIPWTAVTLVGLAEYIQSDIDTIYQIIGLISILSCGILGLVLAYVSFAKQDQ